MSEDNEVVGTIITQIILTRFAVASFDLLVLFECKCRIEDWEFRKDFDVP